MASKKLVQIMKTAVQAGKKFKDLHNNGGDKKKMLGWLETLSQWKVEKVVLNNPKHKVSLGIDELKGFVSYHYSNPDVFIGLQVDTTAVVKYDIGWPEGKLHYIDKFDLKSIFKSNKN